MNPTVTINYLADAPAAVPVLAQWLFDEWGRQSSAGSVPGMIDRLTERLHRDRLPLALVALRGDDPLGTASLRLKEVEIRPQYEHWLSTVYVHAPYRRQGIGSLLVASAVDAARELGIESLYLYTRRPATERLYVGLGWTAVERPELHGRPAVLMKCDLAGRAAADHRPC